MTLIRNIYKGDYISKREHIPICMVHGIDSPQNKIPIDNFLIFHCFFYWL